LTLQVTDVFEEFVTVAVNCCVFPTPTEAVPGDTVTDIVAAAITFTVALPDLVLSAMLVAATTGFVAGTVAGAV
jgi:hypothetical protein